MKEATFLLHFEQPDHRNAALGRGLLTAGRTQIHLMPWSRQFGATASKLKYRVRVCLEGIPSHAANAETIAKLIPPYAFVETIDVETPTEKEKACVCAWVWTVDPDGIAKEGVLRLEEPVEFFEEYHNELFTRIGNMEIPEIINEAAAMLDYKVLIHIDRVWDYTDQHSPSWRSYRSDTSGFPADSLYAEWPAYVLLASRSPGWTA